MDTVLLTCEEKMEKSIAALESNFGTIRAGRANPSVLDRVSVDYYGAPTPINQMAAVSVPEPRLLQIQPWDASTIKNIEKAIKEIGLVQIYLQTDIDVPALGFYLKNGFIHLEETVSLAKEV